MSDSMQERTEAPTPRKREEAKQKGQVPRSQEVTAAFLLLSAGGLIAILGPGAALALAGVVGGGLANAAAAPGDVASATGLLRATGLQVAMGIAPLLVGLALVSATASVIQARGVLSLEPLKPQGSRISPIRNAGRIWGTRAIAELVKSILKLVVVGAAMYSSLRLAWPEFTALGQQGPIALARALGHFAVRLLLTAGGVYLLVAAADYAYQLWSHEKQLRMTKDEVRREHKETEGDPLIKSRLRTLGRAMARRQMFKDVPTADVVVTNPTHIAVALKYDPSASPAPLVLAMGQRKIAERIKRLAMESGVPVVENKPLARALLATGKVGLPIPLELYVAVAEVLAFVFRRRAAESGAWQGSASV